MFVCGDCGYGSSSRLGKCPSCGAFGTFTSVQGTSKQSKKKVGGSAIKVTKEIVSNPIYRPVSMPELQRLFPQGISKAGTYLLAGEPGIGKSTIMLQLIDELYNKTPTLNIAYITGEEAVTQVQKRYERVLGNNPTTLTLLQSNDCDDICATIEEENFDLVIVDSIQTISTNSSDSTAGSASQVRNCCDLLNRACKQTDTTLFLIGHITKGGEIAGPKYLEHIVDVVLYLEGEQYGDYRFLRFKKNRFGHTDDVGIFEMKEQGLSPVYDLKERVLQRNHNAEGSVLTVGIDNGRAVLIQLEVLLNKMSGKYPQRVVQGIESSRLSIIIAILEKYLGIKLHYVDVFVNIPGEFTFRDSGLDLAIAAAIRSQYKGISLDSSLIFIGELGLGGQVMKTKFHLKRRNESEGFTIIDHERISGINQLSNI